MNERIGLTQEDSKWMSDQQAIELLKNGNIQGLAALVQQYQIKAVHTALLITCDRELAEDVVQDAFLKVYRKIAQFDESRPFGPWFLRIVINAAKKMVRKQGRYQSLEMFEDGDATIAWLMDPNKSPEKLSESAEISDQVWDAIEHLTPNQREAIVLRHFLESRESEMVQILGRPSTTIKWWLHAARQRLRRLLKPVAEREFEKEEIHHERETSAEYHSDVS